MTGTCHVNVLGFLNTEKLNSKMERKPGGLLPDEDQPRVTENSTSLEAWPKLGKKG